MKAYIAGPITGNPDYKKQFGKAEQLLKERGAIVMNPAVLPEGFEWKEYMKICYFMLMPCDTVVMLPGWEKSKGARAEYKLALQSGKSILEFTPDYQLRARICTPNKNDH